MTQTKPTVPASLTGKWKPYPAYKDSGVEWLGEVPAHWEVKRVRDITELLQTGPFGSQLHSSEYSHDGIPVINPSHLRDGHVYPDWDCTVDKETHLRLIRHELHKGDIVFARRGEMGRCALITEKEAGWLCGTGSLLMRPRVSLSAPSFLSKVLATGGVRDWLLLESVGSTMDNLNTNILSRIPLPIPPLPEQYTIATYLDRETTRISALIAKKERLIELLQEKRAALISHAVTKGLDPTVPMKDSGIEWLGEIPAHWEVKRLKFVADVLNGVAKGRDLGQRDVIELPYLRVANVQDGYLDLSDIALITVGVDEVERYSLQRGDVLMNEGGDFDKLGRGYVWDGSITPCLHQNHVFAVRPHLGVDPYWISIITLTSYAKHYFILKSKQSTNLASISGTNLKELSVLMPPEDECNAILNYIKVTTARIDALISRIREGIEKLKEYSSALISAAVTGKIDVREIIGDHSEDL